MKTHTLLGTIFLLACTEAPRSMLPTMNAGQDMGTTTTVPVDFGGFDSGTFTPMTLAITGVSPKLASTAGGAQITVTGGPFSPSTLFFINNQLANVMSVTATQAVLLAPPRAGYGPATLVARNPDGQSATNSNAASSPTALSFFAAQLTFQQTAYQTQANRPRSIAFGDLNGDMNLDLVVGHQDQATYSIFVGNGAGSFSPLLPTTTFSVLGGQATNTVNLVDLNGDKKLDLLLGTNSAQFHYYLGNAMGPVNTVANVNYGTSGIVSSQTVADINNDMLPDVITSNVNASNIGLFINTNNAGNLYSGGQYMALNPGSQPTRVLAADLDGDGKMDLVTSLQNNGGPTLAVYMGTGVQATPFNAANPATYGTNNANQAPQWLELGDLNGDSKLDCVVADVNTNTVRVFLGNGTAATTFQAPTAITVGQNPQHLALGDFNGDGRLDVVVTNRGSHTVSVLLGNGDGTFQPRQDLPSINSPWGVVAVDLNNDKKTDFAVANELNSAFSTSPGYATIYLNTSQ